MELFEFIINVLRGGYSMSVQSKVDKKGRPFTSVKFSDRRQHPNKWIKSVVLYQRKDGGVYILVNHGGRNTFTDQEFSSFDVITVKYSKQCDDDQIYVVLKKGKMVGYTSTREILAINKVKAKVRPFIDYDGNELF